MSNQHSRAGQVPPRTSSWDISSRPFGTGSWLLSLPRTSSWATLSSPFGTVPGCSLYPGLRPGLLSAVPSGLFLVVISTQDFVLGYSQPSLRDCSWLLSLPRTSSWATLSRPFGLGPGCPLYPGLRPGLLSAVPTGLFQVALSTQDFVLGYSQPSLRDCSWLLS